MTTVLKLGGSLLTRKDEHESIDEAGLSTAAAAIGAASVDELVLVHGAGSFGHVHADAHGVSVEAGTSEAAAVREIHASMGRLNRRVLAALAEEGVEAIPVRPLSASYRDAEGALWHATDQVAAMLAEGFVPVLHGDVITTREKGATILSGDELVVTVARSLHADAVGLCAGVPGVLDEDDSVIPEIDGYDEVAGVLGGAAETDVTGGMAGKVRTLLELPIPARIFDLEGLPAFLSGGDPGTLVRGPGVE